MPHPSGGLIRLAGLLLWLGRRAGSCLQLVLLLLHILLYLFLLRQWATHAKLGGKCFIAGLLLQRCPQSLELAFPALCTSVQGLSAFACGCSVSVTAYDSDAQSPALLYTVNRPYASLSSVSSPSGRDPLVLCVTQPVRASQSSPCDRQTFIDGAGSPSEGGLKSKHGRIAICDNRCLWEGWLKVLTTHGGCSKGVPCKNGVV